MESIRLTNMDISVSYEDAVKEGESRILFTGPRRSGKSSIERVIFHKMPPHETLFLDTTRFVDIQYIAHNNFLKFQTWDFGGEININQDIPYGGRNIKIETIFKNCSTLIYVIDAQDHDYEDTLPKLVETIAFAHNINKNIHFEVFLHKLDGYFMSEETKLERQQSVQSFVSSELAETNNDVLVSYYLTSIYDHSTSEAFSKVIQKLIPQLPTLNSLLDMLIASSNVEKSYLIDVVTKLYVATDSNPVDVHTYELCSDLVDVIIDVSYIYGAPTGSPSNELTNNHTDGTNQNQSPYDDHSTSVIRLDSKMILYLRAVSKYLALICVMREDVFVKRALVDYNIDIFKSSLNKVFDVLTNTS